MEKIRQFKKDYLDGQVIFIAAVISLMVLYYINPMEHVQIDTWDRTFSEAMGGGVSIANRIRNFYICYVLLPPLLMALITCLAGRILQTRQEYKQAFVMIDTVLVTAVAAAYISRYSSGDQMVEGNPVIMTAMIYQALLFCICQFDKRGILTAERIVFLYISYLVSVVTMVLLLPGIGINKCAVVIGSFFAFFLIFCLKVLGIDDKTYSLIESVSAFWMWLPVMACIVLEGLYILNERGVKIRRYDTVIWGVCAVYAVISLGVRFLLRGGKKSFQNFGYMGALTGLGCAVYIPYSYFQSAFLFLDNAHIYEFGNLALASDTIRNGKVPIVDYFSAHALSDTLPSILYGFLHADMDGALSSPYSGLLEFLGLIVVYFIVKKLFGKAYAVLYACIFPFSLGMCKTVSICMAVVLAMLCALERKSSKAYLCFWVTALVGVFIRYDEGINLGVGCIAAMLCIMIFQKDRQGLKRFIFSGGLVASAALLLYFTYCKATGIHAVSRILEWLSLTANSNSTWATHGFGGDVKSLAFFISYIVVPLCEVCMLIVVIISFAGSKQCLPAAVVMAFSVCGLLFLPRTIVFHNLTMKSGSSGVLYHFIHWNVAVFVYYLFVVKGKKAEVCFAAWVMSFFIVLIAEGVLATDYVPGRDSTLYNRSADCAWERKQAVSGDMSIFWGQERIVWPEETLAFCSQFETVFDLLLEDDETFLDFANITALYAFVERERPFYIAQSPSLLTDLRSQQYYLDEVESHKVPLAVIGETEVDASMMAGVCHNVRYYTIAEYIYRKYRPLVHTGGFTIWCEMDRYEEFSQRIQASGLLGTEYEMAGYKDNLLPVSDEERDAYEYHNPGLGLAAYIWANYDEYNAIGNAVLEDAVENGNNTFSFRGSQFWDSSKGNYIAFECDNTENYIGMFTAVFEDSSDAEVRYECDFSVVPGNNTYIIRVSQDYFWFAYNIDTLRFSDNEEYTVHNVRILEGD